MGDWPDTRLWPLPLITPWSEEAVGPTVTLGSASATPTASGAVVANQAYYYPFRLDVGATARKMFVLIGAAPPGGNNDVGIYDDQFNRLVSSGAVAIGAASTLQEFDITDTELSPGFYWMAFSSSAACTVFRMSISDEGGSSMMLCYEQASAHVLPATATPIKSTAGSVIVIVMGISFDTLI